MEDPCYFLKNKDTLRHPQYALKILPRHRNFENQILQYSDVKIRKHYKANKPEAQNKQSKQNPKRIKAKPQIKQRYRMKLKVL